MRFPRLVEYIHEFIGTEDDLALCAICDKHRWYRLHQPDGKPISRREFFALSDPQMRLPHAPSS